MPHKFILQWNCSKTFDRSQYTACVSLSSTTIYYTNFWWWPCNLFFLQSKLVNNSAAYIIGSSMPISTMIKLMISYSVFCMSLCVCSVWAMLPDSNKLMTIMFTIINHACFVCFVQYVRFVSSQSCNLANTVNASAWPCNNTPENVTKHRGIAGIPR